MKAWIDTASELIRARDVSDEDTKGMILDLMQWKLCGNGGR